MKQSKAAGRTAGNWLAAIAFGIWTGLVMYFYFAQFSVYFRVVLGKLTW
ncbi:MAG: hypothetical protein ACYTAN_05890 [Planctomycetota bacterium]